MDVFITQVYIHKYKSVSIIYWVYIERHIVCKICRIDMRENMVGGLCPK